MPTINAGKYGILSAASTSSWSAVRDGTTANTGTSNQPTSSNGVTAKLTFLTGGKGSEWSLTRSYFAFDVTAYQTGFNITNLELEIDPTVSTSTNFAFAIVKSTAQGNANSNLTSGDWDSLDFNTKFAGSSTTYWPDTNSVSQISLNSSAVAQFSTGYLKICILSFSDYNDDEPFITGTSSARQNFSYVPRINFTATAAGYSNNVNGIDGDDIDNIIGVDAADIDNVSGI
tara:strand:- start:736 stop:1425 length:690 start_codon:yes stop_codon:yes gene_type:complete